MLVTCLLPTILLWSCGSLGAEVSLKDIPLSSAQHGMVGRWILSPGDSHIPSDTEIDPDSTAANAEPLVSPAGSVLTLAENGTMIAREGEFIRRGNWRFDGATLRISVEPPPRKLDMGFIPVVQTDRLTLTGTEGMVLVYHRDPFIAVEKKLP